MVSGIGHPWRRHPRRSGALATTPCLGQAYVICEHHLDGTMAAKMIVGPPSSDLNRRASPGGAKAPRGAKL